MKEPSPNTVQSKTLWLYGGFFVAYLLALYVTLYHPLDLNPFQVNTNFFLNASATFFRRFFADVAPYGALFILLYHTKHKAVRGLLMGLFFLFFFLNISEIGYYNQTQNNFQVYLLKGFDWRIFVNMLGLKRILILSSILIFCVLWGRFLWKMTYQGEMSWLRRQKIFMALFLMIVFYEAYQPIFYPTPPVLADSQHLEKKWSHLMALNHSGVQVFGREAMDYLFPLAIESKPLSLKEKATIESLGLNEKKVTAFEQTPKNIVLIIVESLNQNFISHYNPNLNDSTSFLDSLIQENESLDAFYPSGPYTIHGLTALLCGHTNPEIAHHLPEHVCAPKWLASQGYRTEFIRGSTIYYIKEDQILDKFGYQDITGKETFDLKYPLFKDRRPDLYSTWGFSDDYVFSEAVEKLKSASEDEKLFLTLLTVDTHTPGGRCFDRLEPNDDENRVLFSVQCFDRALNDFFDQLKAHELLEDTVIILTADQLFPNPSELPGTPLQTSFKFAPGNIPLLMMSDQSHQFKATQGSQVDIAPTLLDLVNLATPEYYLGKSLLSNPSTTPLGQYANHAYLKASDDFHHFYLKEENGQRSDLISSSQRGDTVKDDSLSEATSHTTSPIDETGSLWFKWYYNRYHYPQTGAHANESL